MSLQKTFLWPHSKNHGETFEGWATESRQLSASLRQMLARRTSVSDGGSWPMPKASLSGPDYNRVNREKSGGDDLVTAVARCPTPTAGDAKSSGSRNLPGSKAHAGMSLTDYVRGSSSISRLPTPTAARYGTRNNGKRGDGSTFKTAGAPSLDTMASSGQWPTPTAQDSSNNGGPSQAERNTPPLNCVAGGKLNPRWVEWLMGWPIGWASCEHSETVKCLWPQLPLGTTSWSS